MRFFTEAGPANVRPHSSQLEAVGSVVALASARGGAGKSALTVNIAIAAVQAGAKVGILDADLNAPSITGMLGMRPPRRPAPLDWIEPLAGPLGLRVASCDLIPDRASAPASFLEEDIEPAPANGGRPLIVSYSQTLRTLLTQTRWGNLDLLLVDLSCGIEALGRFIEIEPRGAIVLATHPSGQSAHATGEMLEFLKASRAAVLGIVENLVGFNCDRCHSVRPLMPQGAIAALAAAARVPVLERLAFDPRLAETNDHGRFFVRDHADTPLAKQFAALARAFKQAPRLTSRAESPFVAAHPQSSPAPPFASGD